jgi:PAS domain S-box-containing protein
MEMQFKAAMAFVSEGIVFQDAQGRIVYCNPAAERIWGCQRTN